MTAPTDMTPSPFGRSEPDSGQLYLSDRTRSAPPVAVPPTPELSPLDELTAKIAVLEAERDAAMKTALDRDPDVARAVAAVLEATEARDRLADVLSLVDRVLTGEAEKPKPRRRGRRARHTADDSG